MDIREIQNLIKFVSKAEVSEVKYKTKDFEITIKTPLAAPDAPASFAHTVMAPAPTPVQSAPAPQAAAPQAEPAKETSSGIDESNLVTIKSPMIGTFYRKPSPDKDPFVQVGSEVSPNSVVCVIEAMKLFNQIEAEVSGKIVKILVDDASPVEYDQPLFLVDPS